MLAHPLLTSAGSAHTLCPATLSHVLFVPKPEPSQLRGPAHTGCQEHPPQSPCKAQVLPPPGSPQPSVWGAPWLCHSDERPPQTTLHAPGLLALPLPLPG